MKRLLLLLLLWLPVTANAQWARSDYKDPLTEKTTIMFALQSKGPEKARFIAFCTPKNYVYLSLSAHFQVRRNGDADDPYTVSFRGRFDDKVEEVYGDVQGDLDDTIRIVGADAVGRILSSKRVSLEIDEFAGPIHYLRFTTDTFPPLSCR